jgi:hypothetical protein
LRAPQGCLRQRGRPKGPTIWICPNHAVHSAFGLTSSRHPTIHLSKSLGFDDLMDHCNSPPHHLATNVAGHFRRLRRCSRLGRRNNIRRFFFVNRMSRKLFSRLFLRIISSQSTVRTHLIGQSSHWTSLSQNGIRTRFYVIVCCQGNGRSTSLSPRFKHRDQCQPVVGRTNESHYARPDAWCQATDAQYFTYVEIGRWVHPIGR